MSIAVFLLVEGDPPPSHSNWTGKEVAMGQFVKVGTVADFEDVEGGKLVDAGGRGLPGFRGRATQYAIHNTFSPRGRGFVGGDRRGGGKNLPSAPGPFH